MSQPVTGYQDGKPFALQVDEVEDGHLLRSDLVPRAQALLQEARAQGWTVGINSAWRSNSQQMFLHDGWEARRPGFNPADPPGHSNHQNGTALDLRSTHLEELAGLASRYGFARPVEREPWHFVGGDDPLVT